MRSLIFFLFAASAGAQRPSPVPVYGSVSGNITCVDTNLPARLTKITLEPVRETPLPEPKDGAKSSPPMLTVHRTHLDGSFQIGKVVPGRYYVVVEKPGYLSPVSQFTDDEVNHPTPEIKEAIAQAVPIVTVVANANVAVNVSLRRAASVSGVVRFDDGTPASEMNLSFERKGADGKFIRATLDGSSLSTDDQGHFHASGMPAGEYRVETDLTISDVQVDGVFGGNHMMSMNYTPGIAVYYPEVFRKQDAKTIKVEDGENTTADITLPVSKIHALSGTLADARTGHVINAGTIRLYANDDEVASATVDPDESTFRFEFLPEGEYSVKVSDARDVTREEIPYPPGSFGSKRYKETVTRHYDPYEGALVFQSDQTGLVLPIPAAKPGTATVAGTAHE